MKNEEKLKFGSVLNYIRTSRELSMRQLAIICGLSAMYISDLENGNRKPTLRVIECISKKLLLTDEEYSMMMDAFAHDRLQVPVDILYYLIDNDLIESLNILKEVDKKGDNIKRLALSLNNGNNSK